ncbi:MAG: hypothetical protein QNK37_27370 [Acidobacteriota bacterium]|nr:hypothetical protein [Acidobacteriota bacterium]
MKQIHITDSRMRNTRVQLTVGKRPARVRPVDPQNRPATPVRLVKGTPVTDYAALSDRMDPEELAQALIESSPEIDFELFGKRVRETSRVYLNVNNKPGEGISRRERVYDAQDRLLEEREPRDREANIDTAVALKWGKLFPKDKIVRKMVFTADYQLTHGDGLTYDFLYNIAAELQEKNALMMLGAGPGGTEPLVFTRNGTPYRAFLEGRVKDDAYLLVVHLTNLELKPAAA